MLLGGGGGGGYVPTPQYQERHRTLNKPRKKQGPVYRPQRQRPRYNPPSNRGYTPPGGGYGRSRGRGGGGGGGGGTMTGRPASKPQRYAGPPPPSAQMIAQLYGQLGEIGRQKKTYEADYNRSRSGLASARGLFLKQLEDTYKQRQTATAADFAARGLSQSGLLTESIANLGKERATEQAGYQSQYQGQLDEILARLTSQRGELGRRRRTLSDRYNQARGDRARILKLMGGG